jgi:hypothetical protein
LHSVNRARKAQKKRRRNRKMQIAKNKTAAIAIAIFLMFSMGASMMLVPTASAHTPTWQIPTYAFILAAPNPIGVGQATYIYMWLDKVMDGAAIINDIRFHNYQLTITKPDTTTETKTWDIIWDTTSSQGYSYTPNQVGTYTLKFTFPGQVYTWADPVAGLFGPPAVSAYVNDTFVASTASVTLTVQQEPISNLPSSYPLPTEYWTRPIYGENPDWWKISSNWLGTGAAVMSTVGSGTITGWPGISAINRYPGDAIGPTTAHVMWTKPLQPGGVVGGNNFLIQGNTWFEGSAYNQRYNNPIIINGYLYYTEPISFAGTEASFYGVPYGPTVCVDLLTGQVKWSRTDIPALSFGYIYDVEDPNQHGVYPPILFTSNFARAFDAYTGNPLFNVTGVPSGGISSGPQGEQLRYVLANAGNTTNPDYRLGEWNSTKLWSGGGFSGSQAGMNLIPMISGTVDGSVSNKSNVNCRYDWNVSIPWRNTMTSSPTVLAAFYNNIMICSNGSTPTVGSWNPYTYFAVNLNPTKGTVGSVLWWNTVTPLAGNESVSFGGADPTVGVFVEGIKETRRFVGYSMTTGQKLWGPTASQHALDYYGNPMYPYIASQVAYGKLYSSAMGGIVYCYDLPTGKLLWTYGNGGEGNNTNSGFQVPGPYPTFINAVGNGIIYTVTTEHTVETPIYKGALARAINATDGTEIWTLSDYTGEFAWMSYAIADGYATWFNGYDNQIYVVGRGPSATTVTAPDVSVSFGTPVVIKGSVMDISAGTKQNQQAARFPNGVACASDASMSDWMGYVYQQKPLPTNFAGVQVTIDVLDSNFNYRNIGSATTDASGKYSLTWTPDIAGNYTIIANFAGTNDYWPSYSENSFNVMEAPPATPTPTPAAPLPPYEMYTIGAAIAIIIAVAIVGLILLRKRP